MAKLTVIDTHPRCVLAVAAVGTARHRRDQAGEYARLLARLPDQQWRHRHDPQFTPLARVPDLTLPPTTTEPTGHGHAGRTPSRAVPGTAASYVLVPPPVHYNRGHSEHG